jgi:hypothetical protein
MRSTLKTCDQIKLPAAQIKKLHASCNCGTNDPAQCVMAMVMCRTKAIVPNTNGEFFELMTTFYRGYFSTEPQPKQFFTKFFYFVSELRKVYEQFTTVEVDRVTYLRQFIAITYECFGFENLSANHYAQLIRACDAVGDYYAMLAYMVKYENLYLMANKLFRECDELKLPFSFSDINATIVLDSTKAKTYALFGITPSSILDLAKPTKKTKFPPPIAGYPYVLAVLRKLKFVDHNMPTVVQSMFMSQNTNVVERARSDFNFGYFGELVRDSELAAQTKFDAAQVYNVFNNYHIATTFSYKLDTTLKQVRWLEKMFAHNMYQTQNHWLAVLALAVYEGDRFSTVLILNDILKYDITKLVQRHYKSAYVYLCKYANDEVRYDEKSCVVTYFQGVTIGRVNMFRKALDQYRRTCERVSALHKKLFDELFGAIQVPQLCEVCLQKTSQTCGGCKQVYYCGAEHQKMHWRHSHRDYCIGKFRSNCCADMSAVD